VLDNYSHAFGLGGEGEVGQDLVLLLGIVGVENEYLVLLAVAHHEPQLLGELNQSYLIRTRRL
jgi:hypothetical protein